MSQRPIIVGEMLWDCLPDGRVLGGAALNVAWNLAGFGLDPLLISAVGNDDLGHEALAILKRFGLSTVGVQISDKAPTGTVQVSVKDGEPSYNIQDQVAYDFIELPSNALLSELESIKKPPLLYFGSLALRHDTSLATVNWLQKNLAADSFIDINIRQPFFAKKRFLPLLQGARFLKINRDELDYLSAEGADPLAQDTKTSATLLKQKYQIEHLIVTMGAEGAIFLHGQEIDFVASPKPKILRDTVGAGDAFASCIIAAWHRKDNLRSALKKAAAFAASVCELSGATTENLSFYR